jgi:CRP-like cAMP-binding protein
MKVRTLESGSHFGELALINNEKRSLSVRAKSKCKLLRLDREAFTRILGSIEKNLAKDYGNEWQQRLQKMQERRNNSQTFDNNFIEIQELMKTARMMSSNTILEGQQNGSILKQSENSWNKDLLNPSSGNSQNN